MPRRLRLPIALAAVVVLVVSTAATLTRPPDSAEVELVATRIVADPITPTPAPTPEPSGPQECRDLDNPGGDLDWTPSANAGPWPTDGRVALPTLNVDAPIVRVGVDSGGLMVTPPNARDVAWLDQGPIPGQTNNIVLAGHIAYSRQLGSFNRIEEMRSGDPVVVEMDGREWRFRVQWICSFGRNTDLAAQIMGRTEVPSVTLITCGGTFDRRAGTHTNRIVVRAELETSQA